MSSAPTAAPDPVEAAVARFVGGQNCAQAVFAPQAEAQGLAPETAVWIAAMFGGGIVRTGQICGACSGGLMALGLAARQSEQARPYPLGQAFLAAFAERHGSTACRELLGHDLITDEDRAEAAAMGLHRTVCPELVRTAASLVRDLLAEASEEGSA